MLGYLCARIRKRRRKRKKKKRTKKKCKCVIVVFFAGLIFFQSISSVRILSVNMFHLQNVFVVISDWMVHHMSVDRYFEEPERDQQ